MIKKLLFRFSFQGFKDQPDGQCFKCKWNQSNNKDLWCTCPQTHLSNQKCISKCQMIHESNIYNALRDGEEWKEDDE